MAHANITLENPKLPKLKPLKVKALADSGSVFLCVPEHVAEQLQLEEIYEKEVITADGRRAVYPYVGPIHVKFDNRGCMVGAVVMGDEVLLGAIPMEDMDLVVLPQARKVTVNPENPNIATAAAKGVRHPRKSVTSDDDGTSSEA